MNIKDYLNDVKDYFSPKVIGEVNDVYIKVAKIKGKKFHCTIMNKRMNYFTLSKEAFYLKLKENTAL